MALFSEQIIQELQNLGDPTKAKIHQKFFKTGVGEYGKEINL